ncbi:EamA family transporter [Anaerobacillus alkalidiazotrophicus]|uniref:EamA family transporter n=1 Tax=Anaerobacillus alkalidiazotrophicus TaxID=472963 RepID=A0A1S2M323_9BACI|nr:DMT family transporter [Anaerobacillus alkalidiazotrophicus]OIJ18986.1 EamA family transporter [Anaerobacillus alkalidiazotrophicus]
MNIKKMWLIYLMLFLATSTWGSAFIAGKIAIESFEAATVAFFRFLGAVILLFPLMWYKERNIPKPTKEDWFLFALLGLTGICFYNIFFFLASKHAPVIKSSLFIASNPVLIIILSALFLKEKILKNQVVGLVFALFGVSFIITNGNLSIFLTMAFEPIDLILIGAVICWALYSVIGRVVLRKYSSIVSTTYAVCFGTLFLLPFALYETTVSDLTNSTIDAWVAIGHMSVFVTVISFIMYYYGIQQIGAARASIFINFMPISAVIMANVFLNEQLTIPHLIGAFFVLTGVTLSTYKKGWKSSKNEKKQRTV